MPRVIPSVPHLPHSAIVKAPGLLPMRYRLGELAEALGIPPRIIHRWMMDKELPYTRDGQGHLWINGEQCKDWINRVRREQDGQRLAPDEAYCLRCCQPVKLINPTERQNGRRVLLAGECPNCGAAINRGVRRG